MDNFYDCLARHYDTMQSDMDVRAWAEYYASLIERHSKIKVRSITDLGCGTGSVDIPLAKMGYKVTGIDSAGQMLTLASARRGAGKIIWSLQDITDFELPFKTDCFISVLDTVDHITDENAIRKMLANIADYLNAGGVFVFDAITRKHLEKTLADNVFYEDGLGIVGWVRGQRVLIGNRAHLVEHNIQPPALAEEELHTKRGFDVTYITVGGDLIAMLILSYKTDRNISRELRSLEQNGVSLIVRTVDSNLTREKVAERFGLFHRSVTILNTTLGQVCQEAIDTPTDRSRAYLVTRGKLSSFAKAISGCIRLKTTATITRLLQYIAIIFGLALVILISFVSGFDKLGILQMLIYIGFWSITSLIVSLIRK